MEITACFDNSRAGFWLHAAIECEEQFCRGSFICPPRVIHLAFIQTAVDKHREADTGDPERMRGRPGLRVSRRDGLRRSAARPAICTEIVHGISPSSPELYGRPTQRQFPSTFGPSAAP